MNIYISPLGTVGQVFHAIYTSNKVELIVVSSIDIIVYITTASPLLDI